MNLTHKHTHMYVYIHVYIHMYSHKYSYIHIYMQSVFSVQGTRKLYKIKKERIIFN